MTIPGIASLLVAACFFVTSCASAAPTRAALDHARSLVASRMGVDKTNHLWAWNALEGEVTLVSPQGGRRAVDVGFDVMAIDVDAERGIAIIRSDGSTVAVIATDGKVSQFTLPVTTNGIAWLEGDKIAVTPDRTNSLAEIWSVSTKSMVRTLGDVPPIQVPTRGAVLNRAMLIQYNDQRHELTVFDAFYGNATVFDVNGKPLRTAQITHPRLEPNLAWLRDLDASSKAQGTSQNPTMYNYARISVTPDGVIWLGEEGPTAETITLAKVLPDGKVQRKSVSIPECPSVRYEVWQGQLVFFRDPKSPRKQCTATKEVPR